MKNVLKFSGYIFLSFCGLIVLAVIVLQLISNEQYKAWTTAAAESATGRALAVNGPFDLDLGSRVTLLAEDISFSNADWGTRDNMVTADRLYVELALLPLLRGVLDLRVELDSPDLLLETNDTGEGNWILATSGETPTELETKPADPDPGDGFILPFKPYIRNFKINNFLFAFNNRANDQTIEAHLEILRLFVDEQQELPLILNAVYQGSPVTLEGTLGNIDDWYSNKQTPIVLNGKLNEAGIKIEGTAGPIFPQPTARFDLSISAADISTFSPFAGMELPELAGLNVTLTARTSAGQTAVENININLDDPQFKAAVTGTITDLTKVAGINLKADLSTDQGTALSRKLGALNIEAIPDSLNFNAAVSGDLESLALTALDLSVQDQGVDIKLSGTMGNIMKLEGADATLKASIDTLDIIGGYIGQKLPGFGPIDMSASIISPENITQLKSLMVNLSDPVLSAQLSGTTGHIALKERNKLHIDNISLMGKADSKELEGIIKKLGIELPGALPASFSLETAAAGNLDKLGIDSLEFSVKDEGVDVNLSVTAENILDQSGIIAALTTDVANTANLSKFAGMEIPDLGSLALKGQVSSVDKTYKIDSLDFQLDGKDVRAKINATIQDLLVLAEPTEEQEKYGTAGIDLTFDANVLSISGLISEITGIEAPDLGTLKVTGHMSSPNETLGLESLNLRLDGTDLQARVQATVQNLLVLANGVEKPETIGGAGIDLSLDANIESISDLLANTTGIELPDLGGLQINGQARSVEQTLQLKSLNAALKHDRLAVTVDATIADIFALSGINSTVNVTLDSLQTLASITNSELPETGPWLLNVRASSDGLKKSPLIFKAQLEGEGTKTVVDATIPDIKTPQTILAKLTVDAESLAPLEAFLDKDLPEDKPLRISTNVAITPGEYSLKKIMILFDQGKILSNLTYTTPLEGEAGRRTLSGQASIQDFDITPFLSSNPPPSEKEQEPVVPTEIAEEKSEPVSSAGDKKLFSNEPLKVGALQDYDVDLNLEVKDFTIHEGFAVNGTIAVTLDNGLLLVDPFALTGTSGGKADGRIELDARDTEAHLDVVLDFNDFVLPRLGGKFNLDADLDAEGDSIAALMAGLDGFFVARLNDAELEQTRLTKFGAGIVSNVNPLNKDETTLECAITRFDIIDGMVEFEDKIAAQTTEVSWVGGGTINLKTEELDFGVAPKARAAISSLTDIGLASLIHIGGTLAEPEIGIDKTDIAIKYAQYSAHIATGGLSFLAQKAYENRQSNQDYCQRILAELKDK